MASTVDLSKTYHDRFHSFCVRPDLAFDSQGDGEEVILTLRAHPITFFTWILNTIIVLILLFILNFFLPFFQLSPVQIFFVDAFSILALAAYVWLNILYYIFNVGIMTNVEILDVDFSGLLYKEVTASLNEKVEQITNKTSGYFASLFNFGDIFVETAGEDVNIEFLKVPRPADAVKLMNQIIK